MIKKIGINGFGRIGRNVFKVIQEKYSNELEVVAVNDLTDAKTLAHLLMHDSIYGKFSGSIRTTENSLIVNEKEIRILAERDPANINWKEFGIDLVLESTGLFTKREKAEIHITKGRACKVIISAPAVGDDITIVYRVNEDKYDPERHHVISSASCTTNCLAPVAKVINDHLKIIKGFMTTVHAYTNDQKILDLPHSDLRRARAAAMSIIPTKTGAAKAIGMVIPELSGKLNGFSLRVPVPAVSVVDLVAEIKKTVTKEEVNAILRAAADGKMKGIMSYSEEPLVSSDYIGDPASSIIDALSTMVIDSNLIKVVSWYDNEWGYSNRCADLVHYIACV